MLYQFLVYMNFNNFYILFTSLNPNVIDTKNIEVQKLSKPLTPVAELG